MPEPTAAEQIDRELRQRQEQFAAWFAEDATEPHEFDNVQSIAREYGWEPPTREDDETDDEYLDRVRQDAQTIVVHKRDEDNAIEESVLGFTLSVTITARIDLSTGGPGDYVTAEYDPSDGTIDDVTYHFVPWFDHADVPVPDGSPLYRVMERFTSAYNGMHIDEIVPRD